MARPGISTKNTEKIPPGPKFWSPKKIPQKYRKKTKMRIFLVFLGYFLVFSGYCGAKFWESRISGRGVFFRYFSWKFRVGPFRGSVAGRGVLNFSNNPEGPNLETFQDLSTRLKFSSKIETNDIFKRDCKFQVSHPQNPNFCGEFSRSRLNISSEIEVFTRKIEKFKHSSEIGFFFKIRALWENECFSQDNF